MKGSVKLPVFIDDARKLVNTTQLRAKYLGASYESEYCQWQTLHGLGSLMETASLIITPNAYLEGKLLASYPPDPIGDFDVTRATTATRVNSQGLVELVPYNLLTWSEDFSNADWTKSNVTISANSTISPSGNTDADTLTASGGTGLHTCFWPTAQFGANHTISVYAKKNTNNFLQIYTDFVNTDYANFDLNNGVVGSVGSTVISSSIESVGNGWYRCSFVTGASASKYVNFSIISSATSPRTESNALTTSVFIWGAQLVEGSVAKDYQKTETRLNIPRLDYSNGTCPSILVEPQRTNLITYSSSFDISPWIAIGTTITPNTQVAPDGTTTGDTYSTSQSQLLLQTVAASTNTTYTLSMWVKLGTATNLCLVANNTAAWNTIGGESFDSADGLNTSTWTRISWTFNTPSILPAGAINIHLGGNAQTGLTQSTGTVYIWGAQLEAGDYASSYIPTLGASVTRNADVISKTGISSLIGQTEGTLFWDVDFQVVANNDAIFIKDNASYDTFVFMQKESSGIIACGYYGSGALQARIESSAVPTGRYKIAFAYKNNDFVMYLNGTQAGTDTSGTVSGLMDYFDLHWTESGCNNTNASALWKTRLTNTQLAQLTAL